MMTRRVGQSRRDGDGGTRRAESARRRSRPDRVRGRRLSGRGAGPSSCAAATVVGRGIEEHRDMHPEGAAELDLRAGAQIAKAVLDTAEHPRRLPGEIGEMPQRPALLSPPLPQSVRSYGSHAASLDDRQCGRQQAERYNATCVRRGRQCRSNGDDWQPYDCFPEGGYRCDRSLRRSAAPRVQSCGGGTHTSGRLAGDDGARRG